MLAQILCFEAVVMSGLAVGIDLGTTNSLAAVYNAEGEIVLVKDAGGNVLVS